MSGVDSNLVKHFNIAAQLGHDGEHGASLSAYRAVVARASDPGGPKTSPAFIATARMRIGFCLMDLGQYEEAMQEFADMAPLVGALPHASRFEYHFAYGNTLGMLRRLEEMYRELVQAMSVAEDMGDYTSRLERCWVKILTHAERAQGWDFIELKAPIAANTSHLRGMMRLYLFAEDMLSVSRRSRQQLN
jgi:tetratricopeptide (TPR) repeat protein